MLEKVIGYVKSSAVNERDYYTIRILELNKELNNVKSKLNKLMDFYLEDKLSETEYDEKRGQLITIRDKIIRELEVNNNADDNFNERMLDVLQIVANAHKVFLLPLNEKKEDE